MDEHEKATNDELREIAQLLYDESEEYDFDDGMGRGASQYLWDKLAQVLEKLA